MNQSRRKKLPGGRRRRWNKPEIYRPARRPGAALAEAERSPLGKQHRPTEGRVPSRPGVFQAAGMELDTPIADMESVFLYRLLGYRLSRIARLGCA